jgi:hypothetical protein
VAPSAWLLCTGLSFSALNDELSGALEQLVDDPDRVPHRVVLFPVSEGRGWAMGHTGEDTRGEAIAEGLFQQLGDVG